VTELDGKASVALNLKGFDGPHLDLSRTPVWRRCEDDGAKVDRQRQRWISSRLD
jgi:hypothetical protein